EDTFNEFTYENKKLNEAEGYYTEENDEVSLVIYLTSIDELPVEEEENESMVAKQLEKFTQTNILKKEKKKKTLEFFRQEELLFAKDMQGLKVITKNRDIELELTSKQNEPEKGEEKKLGEALEPKEKTYIALVQEQGSEDWNDYKDKLEDETYDLGIHITTTSELKKPVKKTFTTTLMDLQEAKTDGWYKEEEVEAFLATIWNKLKLDEKLNDEEPVSNHIPGDKPLDPYDDERYVGKPYKKEVRYSMILESIALETFDRDQTSTDDNKDEDLCPI
ncbi:13372_t:CDS:2, partial [Cetraspora pellucida]